MATAAACWSKLAHSSSIIVLLVVVALAMAPIAHQSDDHTTNMTDQRPYYHHPTQFTPGAGGHRSSHDPPCASCPYPGACPWCHIR
ncbi:hypothetical protein C2845_PM12G14860 [Panicum miliaceum]|uniref:Uncharacterized protein n=1 Tax=Panicum miliaceum TaxID=4540 RepID=A0A3L6QD36_PANMI|nr:hypothetical protein C2845_PM12G14860 [Panicum miliaceum]